MVLQHAFFLKRGFLLMRASQPVMDKKIDSTAIAVGL
jgi:hypothetical protein